ncbi:protein DETOXIFICATION 15-like [Solanum lycopersicum]|uniref:protein DETOXIFICATION 15-like n=1 Tax=Solanum lycopersicum TaxID=4081 RepID=UPI003749DF1A
MIHEKNSQLLLDFPLLNEKDPENGIKRWYDMYETIEELKKQLELAGPLVVVGFMQYFLLLISVMFVGHLGELSLSSATLATSFAGVTGFRFMLGMASALETLCGQAYGAKQYHMLGIHMQRGMLVVVAISIPISIVWAFAGHIFAFCGQDVELSIHAGVYARWLIPSILPYGLLQCQLRFLQTQSRLKPLLISTGFTSLLHVFLCWALVSRLGLGNKGAALCNAISYWINALILALYIRYASSCEKTWTGFSKEGARNFPSFLSLAIPSACMIWLVSASLTIHPSVFFSKCPISTNFSDLFLSFQLCTFLDRYQKLGAMVL